MAIKRFEWAGGKSFFIAIADGMAATGSIYSQPSVIAMKYDGKPNHDLITIGGDMWRAIDTYNEEEKDCTPTQAIA